MKNLLMVCVLVLGVGANAEMINNGSSPYAALKNYSTEEKAQFAESFTNWLSSVEAYDAQEKAAIESLFLGTPGASGDELLEQVDTGLVKWFYGLQDDITHYGDYRDHIQKVARISRTPDTQTCLKYSLCVIVSKGSQRLTAYSNGSPISGLTDQKVSTARAGKVTPVGIFSVEELAGPNRRSGLYNGAFMGWAMQIHGNYFLHATSKDQYSKLGSPASAGCIRMYAEPAQQLNALMKSIGRANIRVVVQ